jgi:undecaprenyl-diphosphatase
MTFLQGLILGIIQGLTEFLPISSSGHLKLGQIFFGFEDLEQYVLFDLICHFGTLCAIFTLLAAEISLLFRSDRSKLITIMIATLPLFPLVLVLGPIKEIMERPEYLGCFFLITALFLHMGDRSERIEPERAWSRGDALKLGIAQAVAVLPGISRSGSMISTARVLGWPQAEAIRFTILMAVPAILGGMALETLEVILGTLEVPSISWSVYFAGFFTSFGTGAIILRYLLTKFPDKGYFRPFKWYCMALGITTLILLN